MLEPRKRGVIHEEQCKLYFLSLGYDVSVPIGEGCFYDFILDAEDHLFKIQCKKPQIKDGVIFVDAFTTKPIWSKKDQTARIIDVRYDRNKVDFFAAFYDNNCYLVPYTDDLPKSVCLRIVFPRTRSSVGNVRWAKEYEADYILGRILHPDITPIRNVRKEFDEVVPPSSYQKDKLGLYTWITNGVVNKKLFSGDIPEGFRPGRVMSNH